MCKKSVTTFARVSASTTGLFAGGAAFSHFMRGTRTVQGELFLMVPNRQLQGLAARPLPCSYYVIQLDIALSRRRRCGSVTRKLRRSRYRRHRMSVDQQPGCRTSRPPGGPTCCSWFAAAVKNQKQFPCRRKRRLRCQVFGTTSVHLRGVGRLIIAPKRHQRNGLEFSLSWFVARRSIQLS